MKDQHKSQQQKDQETLKDYLYIFIFMETVHVYYFLKK